MNKYRIHFKNGTTVEVISKDKTRVAFNTELHEPIVTFGYDVSEGFFPVKEILGIESIPTQPES